MQYLRTMATPEFWLSFVLCLFGFFLAGAIATISDHALDPTAAYLVKLVVGCGGLIALVAFSPQHWPGWLGFLLFWGILQQSGLAALSTARKSWSGS